MSKWYEPKKEDMEVNKDDNTLTIYVDSDEFGAIYVAPKIEDLKELLS